jgi:hypothetical protein
MFKIINKMYTILSYPGRYLNIRQYSVNSSTSNYRILCCNAFKNKCECVYTCKQLEPIKACIYVERLFNCEITNKPKKPGMCDCSCEDTCIARKSETQLIHDHINNDNDNLKSGKK